MKKIYSLLAAGLLASGLTASAQEEISFTIKVNEPNTVAYSSEYGMAPVTLTEEETVVTATDWGYGVYVNLTLVDDDYFFKDVTDSTGAPIGYVSITDASFTAYGDNIYEVEVYNAAANRTASFTLNVDDPSMVKANFNNRANVSINENTQIVKFNPEEENVLSIAGTSDYKPLYSVKLDGATVDDYYGTFEVPLTDGCVIDVEANYPDIYYTVNLLYGEGAEGFFTKATIDGEQVEDFDGKSFQAQMGSQVMVYGDTQNYMFENLSVNGEEQTYFYGYYRFNIYEDTELLVGAHKAGTVNFTVNVNKPECVTVYHNNGYGSGDRTVFELNEGDNPLELSEKSNEVNFEANPGCYIVSVTDQTGEVYEWGYFAAKEGYTYYIVAEELTIDQTAVIYLDDMQPDYYFYSYYDLNSSYSPLDLEKGYNVIPFGAGLNPFSFSWYGAPEGQLYINDELISPMFEGTTTYNVSLEDKDVVKIFLAEAPTTCNVTFYAPEGVEASVVRDVITEVADYAAGFTAFNGTQVNISGSDLTEVKANGTDVEAEDGVYTIIINEDTEICFNGVESGVAAMQNAADAPVYNLQGIKVGTRASIKSLPAGVYVVDGRKVAVK